MKKKILIAGLFYTPLIFGLNTDLIIYSNNATGFFNQSGQIKDNPDFFINNHKDSLFIKNNNNIIDDSLILNVNNQKANFTIFDPNISKMISILIKENYIGKEMEFYNDFKNKKDFGIVVDVFNDEVYFKKSNDDKFIIVNNKSILLPINFVERLNSSLKATFEHTIQKDDKFNLSYSQTGISWTPIYNINLKNEKTLDIDLVASIKNNSNKMINNINNLYLINSSNSNYEAPMLKSNFAADNSLNENIMYSSVSAFNDIENSDYNNLSYFKLNHFSLNQNSKELKTIKEFKNINYEIVNYGDLNLSNYYTNSEVNKNTYSKIKIPYNKNKNLTKIFLPTGTVSIYDKLNNTKNLYHQTKLNSVENNDIYLQVPANKSLKYTIESHKEKNNLTNTISIFNNSDKDESVLFSLERAKSYNIDKSHNVSIYKDPMTNKKYLKMIIPRNGKSKTTVNIKL